MHRSPAALARGGPAILLPLLAVIAVAPLIAHGCSCGHDFEFHLESWLDAAGQMRHGTLDPAWTVTAAWNAGEPRFLFYPPLSWIFGALLALTMPFPAAPIVFTAVALLAAAFAMYLLARDYASPTAAILASAVYIASPYMLFTAFERTAYESCSPLRGSLCCFARRSARGHASPASPCQQRCYGSRTHP